MQQNALAAVTLEQTDEPEAASKTADTRPQPEFLRSGYLPTLDGWRAVAIISVLVCHGSEAVFHDGGMYPNAFWYRLTRHGAFGVDIFFGISGLLICSRLLRERRREGRISLAGFYIRRAFRILPPYLAYLIAIGALGYCGVLAVHHWEFLSCLLFFRNYIASHDAGWYLGHFWSLAVEEHFYLIWPGLLVLFTPRRARWATPLLALAIAGWRTLDSHEQWISRAGGIDFYGRTDIRLDALLWGCWAALLLDSEMWRKCVCNRLSTGVWLVALSALLCCVAYQPPLAMLWQAILVPMVLVGTVLRSIEPVTWILEARPIRWIGRLSYSLYIWQQLFLVSSAESHPLPMGALQKFPMNVVFVFAAAIVSYYIIERRFMEYRHSLSKRMCSSARTRQIVASFMASEGESAYADSI
ncbi:MAG: acyltransferase [Candidatus Binataceae bacterium]|jgi:peptidoglycan/LPS O-acetylase OafA/YrhL